MYDLHNLSAKMIEKLSNPFSTGKLTKGIRKAATVFAITLVLTGCSTSKEKPKKIELEITKLEKKVAKLEQKAADLKLEIKQDSCKLIRLKEDYYEVSKQWEIQEGLKKEGADSSINQDIGYSIERTNDLANEISDTKKNMAEAQKKLTKTRDEIILKKEEINSKKAGMIIEHSEKPEPDRYNYIDEEFKRSKEAK